MTITRHASAGARRTWFRPAPRCLLGTTAGSNAAPAQRPGSKQVARIAAAIVAIAALAAAGVAGRAAVAASFAVLGHLHWLWIPAAVLLESASMAAFAIMLRRLLAAGGASVGVRPMLATAYAANAVSVSVPLAGPALATAFTFRRFTRQGADAPLAGWSLLTGGVTSSAAAALVVVAGALASGNILVAAVAVPGGVLAITALVVAAAAARRPRLRGALERPAAWALQQGSRMLRRPGTEPRQIIRAWAQRLGSLQLPSSGWVTVTGLALANWLADAAVLAVSIRAIGATVPWHDLLLVYGTGIAAQSLNITPGGLGVTEGTLSLALVATGLGASQALAAVLLYRLASFWLVALAGWLVLLWLRRPRARRGTEPRRARPFSSANPATRGHQDTPVPETNLPSAPPRNRTPAMTADTRTTYRPARLAAHGLVLLHGQPGSPADWQQVTARLPAHLHAIAAGRPGYGSSRLPACRFAANARAVLDDLDARGITCTVLVGHPGRGHGPLWRTFLTEQRALLRELGELEHAIASVQAPVLLLADPRDTLVPLDTARRPARALPDALLQLTDGAGHHLPRRAPDAVADAIAAFLAATEEADNRVERRSLTFGGLRRVKAAVVLADPLALAGTADAYRGCG
jgi:putative heme transporter